MKPLIFSLLMAGQQGAGSSGGSGSMVTTLIPFALIILIFYFLIIRPQSKKQKDTKKMLDALKKGDKVVTIGGMHGVVSAVKETTVIIKLDTDVKVEFNRSAVAGVVNAAAVKAEKPEKKGKAKAVEEKPAEEAAKIEEKPEAGASEAPKDDQPEGKTE
jgi:preprotein translocase subunit YajC